MGAGVNGNNQCEWEGNGNKIRLNLGLGIGMGISHWEWEGMGLKKIFPLISITNIVNLSLSSGQFHPILKESTISSLIKKSTLDKVQLSNYRPVSNLSLISKIIEHVVKFRLSEHLSSNNLLNPHQSAYTVNITPLKLLFSIFTIISLMPLAHRKYPVFVFSTSQAFDTIDHNILITRLSSWFGLHGSVLEWFKSYLSDLCFRVKCENSFSSSHTCSCGVPQGSVLGPLFSSCIPLHSALSSHLSP